ncbi:hypothetical protein [Robiginitomaculum antarcticum]|uniref:hypothetical protein n=1 Tax=Robiginitomaculum antarcticum TaxID=437507 RepID=UPI00039BF4EF|nr:hypothetical protein [Robiginitomaculum antarcticum]
MGAVRKHSSQPIIFGLFTLIAAIWIAIPFWGITNLPLADYVNHLARFHIV